MTPYLRPRRSMLYVPGCAPRFLNKARSLKVDSVIFDLGDSVLVENKEASRNQIVDAQAGWWGERWIILPNPMYGSWEDAISNIQNDAVSQTYGAELERRRLLKGRALRGVDWWANPPKIEEKTK